MSGASAVASLPGRWTVLWMLVIVRVAMGYQFQAAASAAPWLIGEFKIDYATVGSLVGFYTLPGILFALPGGYIARRIGEKNLLLFGLALMTAGGGVSAVGGDFAWVMGGRLISAFGVVFLFVVMTKAVGDWFQGGERFLAMALFLNGWPVGIAIALVGQPALAEALSWHWIFLTTGILAAAALLTMAATFRHPPGYHEEVAAAGRQRLGRRAIVLVVISGLAWSTINSGHIIISFAPTFLAARGSTPIEAGAVVSLNMWVGILGVMLGGWITGRFRRPVTLVALTVLAGAGAALPFALDTNYALWLTLSGLVVFMGAGVQAALPLEALSTGNRALGLGLFYALWFLGFALLPSVGGWTRDVTGDPSAPILLGVGLLALTAPLLVLFRLLQRRWHA